MNTKTNTNGSRSLPIIDPDGITQLWTAVKGKHGAREGGVRAFCAELSKQTNILMAVADKMRARAFVQEITSQNSSVETEQYGILERFVRKDASDLGWMKAFDVRDFLADNGPNCRGFDVNAYTHNCVFGATQPGEPTRFYAATGTQSNVAYVDYTGGLLFEQNWLTDGQHYKIADAISQMVAAHDRAKANLAYALIIAAATTAADIAYAGISGESQPVGDAKTIWSAISTIGSDIEGLGYGIDPTSLNVVVMAHPGMRMRTEAAMAIAPSTAQVLGGPQPRLVGSNVTTVYSYRLTASQWFVILPGFEAIWANRKNLTLAQEANIEQRAIAIAGHARFNGVVGQTLAMRRADIA